MIPLMVIFSGTMIFAELFTLRESRGCRISFVVKDSQYVTTASPLAPQICNILDLCNIRVKIKGNDG